MTRQEVLLVCFDVLNNYSAAQWVDQILSIRMNQQTVWNASWIRSQILFTVITVISMSYQNLLRIEVFAA